MGDIRHSNNATSTLASGITAVATSLTVGAGHGARFPAVGSGLYAKLTIEDASGNIEIVHLTAKSGDVFTVVRAQEGTAGFAFSSGARVENRVTAAVLDDFFQKVSDIPLALGGSTAAALVFSFNSAHVSGPYMTMSRSGVAFGDLGNGVQLGTGYTLDAPGLNARGSVLELGTNNIMRARFTGAALYLTGTVELGHATDTTLARIAAGRVSIEGVEIARLGAEFPTVELGHASDTTLARASAGEMTIEGNQVYHAGNQPLASGFYAPTLVAVTNLDSNPTASATWWYYRVGTVVHVFGFITLNPTTSGIGTSFTTSLPIASTIPAGRAQGFLYINLGVEFQVSAATSGSLVTFSGLPQFSNAQNGSLSFSYIVA